MEKSVEHVDWFYGINIRRIALLKHYLYLGVGLSSCCLPLSSIRNFVYLFAMHVANSSLNFGLRIALQKLL